MRRDTVCFSWYSLMSKRSRPFQGSGELPGEFGLAHAGQAAKRSDATGLSLSANPARDLRMAFTTLSTAASWPYIFSSGPTPAPAAVRARRRKRSPQGSWPCGPRHALPWKVHETRPVAVGSLAVHLHPGPRLVQDVDCLVREVAVVDVLRGELRRGLQGVIGEVHLVIGLVLFAQALEDGMGLFDSSARAPRSSGTCATAPGPCRRTCGSPRRSWNRCTAPSPR